MKVEQIAAKLNVSPQTLRQAIQENKIPFACAVEHASGKYSYILYPLKVKEYIGDIDPEDS